MVLRSGRRLSLENEANSKKDSKTKVSPKKETSVKKSPKKSEEKSQHVKGKKSIGGGTFAIFSPIFMPSVEVMEQNPPQKEVSDDDDEAPEDVGFAEAKSSFLKEVREQKKSSKEREEKRREKIRQKQEQKSIEKKLKKQKKDKQIQEDALPEDYLNEISEKEKEATRVNTVKTFQDEEFEMDEDISDSETCDLGTKFEVVSRKDQKKLNNVSESVLNYKNRLLYGDRIKRESPDELYMRKKKKAKFGSGQFAIL
jgi:hypothetical protein